MLQISMYISDGLLIAFEVTARLAFVLRFLQGCTWSIGIQLGMNSVDLSVGYVAVIFYVWTENLR